MRSTLKRRLALQVCWVSFAVACAGSSDGQADTGVGSNRGPTRLRDTTGAQFERASETVDTLESVEGLSIECGGMQLAEFKLERGRTGLALICGLDPRSKSVTDYLCRPVACRQPAECPTDFACDQGLCRCQADECRMLDAGSKLHSLELMARCLATIPRYPRCLQAFTDPSWATVSQVLLNECDGEGLCTLPTECS